MRDADTLLSEARSLETDAARRAWFQALSPEEQEAVAERLGDMMEAIRRLVNAWSKCLEAMFEELGPTIGRIIEIAKENGLIDDEEGNCGN